MAITRQPVTQAVPQRPRTGRLRNEEARRAILDAALELSSDGLAQTSVDAIAARAGVGKQTIYRWWPSKSAVILDALLEQADRDVPAERVGPLDVDLARFLTRAFDAITRPGGTGGLLRALMAEAQVDPAFAEAWRTRFIEPRRAALISLLDAAVQRNEAPQDLDRELIADLLLGTLWYRLLVQHAPLDERLATQLAHAMLRLVASAS